MGLHDILDLEPHGADTWVGTGPRYPWGGLYGGQIVAQALLAAAHTVGPALHPHSLRAYFIRAGDQDEPVRYEVDRLRNGRSFTTRRVVARQAVGAILNLEASFTGGDDSVRRQRVTMPAVPGPDDLEADGWTDLVDRRVVPPELGSGVVHVWLRFTEEVGDDAAAQEAGFAYLSDDTPSEAIRCLLTEPGGDMRAFDASWFLVSLDHTVWFHEPIRPDRWYLHSCSCDRFVAGRGLTDGRVFAEDGTHVATIAQEMLLRPRR
jgi:acyl-CoA thioesterase-2